MRFRVKNFPKMILPNLKFRWLAATHFAASGARHAFPCYDEPSFKAKFKIRISHGLTYHAVSNMPETRLDSNSDDTVITSFDETPLMSTFLVAFVVSDFPFSANSSDSKTSRYRIYAQPSSIPETQLALNTIARVVETYEKYFEIEYAFPKLDQMVIPTAPSGGMENWGKH